MRTREILRAARRDGRAAGIGAASWAYDGNTTRETYARILKGFDDCDGEILDSHQWPNLSGEWAGDPAPRSLCHNYGVTDERDPDGYLMERIMDAWEDAAREAFETNLTRVCREALKP